MFVYLSACICLCVCVFFVVCLSVCMSVDVYGYGRIVYRQVCAGWKIHTHSKEDYNQMVWIRPDIMEENIVSNSSSPYSRRSMNVEYNSKNQRNEENMYQ